MIIRRLIRWDPQPNWEIGAATWVWLDSTEFNGAQIISGNFWGKDQNQAWRHDSAYQSWGEWRMSHRHLSTGQPYSSTTYPITAAPLATPYYANVTKCVNDPEAYHYRWSDGNFVHWSLYYRRGAVISRNEISNATGWPINKVVVPGQPFSKMRLRNGQVAYYIVYQPTNSPPNADVYIRRIINLNPSDNDIVRKIALYGTWANDGLLTVDQESYTVWFGTVYPETFGGAGCITTPPTGVLKFDEDLNIVQKWTGPYTPSVSPGGGDTVRQQIAHCGNIVGFEHHQSNGIYKLRTAQITTAQPWPTISEIDYGWGLQAGQVAGARTITHGLAWLQDGIITLCDRNLPGALLTGC